MQYVIYTDYFEGGKLYTIYLAGNNDLFYRMVRDSAFRPRKTWQPMSLYPSATTLDWTNYNANWTNLAFPLSTEAVSG